MVATRTRQLDLSYYRRLLAEVKGEVTKKIKRRLTDALSQERPRSHLSSDMQIEDSLVDDDTVSSYLTKVESDRLTGIELALVRIEDGSYGICRNCKDEISEARLKAVPESPLCRECLSSQEAKTKFCGSFRIAFDS